MSPEFYTDPIDRHTGSTTTDRSEVGKASLHICLDALPLQADRVLLEQIGFSPSEITQIFINLNEGLN